MKLPTGTSLWKQHQSDDGWTECPITKITPKRVVVSHLGATRSLDRARLEQTGSDGDYYTDAGRAAWKAAGL